MIVQLFCFKCASVATEDKKWSAETCTHPETKVEIKNKGVNDESRREVGSTD